MLRVEQRAIFRCEEQPRSECEADCQADDEVRSGFHGFSGLRGRRATRERVPQAYERLATRNRPLSAEKEKSYKADAPALTTR